MAGSGKLIYWQDLQVVVIEVESKYLSPGNDEVEKALVKMGAKKIAEETMEDVYFSHPNKDFGKTDEALRLRKKLGGAELSYKGPRMNLGRTKAREEINVGIDNALAAQRIVESLGFRELCVVKKKRKSFRLDRLRVDIDDVDGLGEYVELEALTESPERSAQLIELAVKELSLERLERKTYLELILERSP